METSETQDTGKFRTNNKDQFYTHENVAKMCINLITKLVPHTSTYLWVEPSAGNGAFLHNIPSSYEKIGLDLDPKAPTIVKQDYLKWIPPHNKNIIVFGNPPFGRQSSLAKAFIIKSCEFAHTIAFILPKSFIKPSMYNAFDLKFHMLHSVELEKNSFVINGANYDETIIDRELNGNPHNSFIRAHHNYGLLYVIFILSTIFLCIFTNQSFKKIILYGSIMLVLVFRIWTEPILFPTILDFYFFSIFFTIYNYEPKLIRI
jgi:hypothetical protein